MPLSRRRYDWGMHPLIVAGGIAIAVAATVVVAVLTTAMLSAMARLERVAVTRPVEPDRRTLAAGAARTVSRTAGSSARR